MDKIAIIGTACLFPGAKTPEAYWQNLINNIDSRVSAEQTQMGRDPAVYFDKNKGVKDKYYCTLGGYIQDFEFDANGYALDAKRLQALDDTFKWSLYVSREALKNAGYLDDFAKLKQCGVILGNLSFPTKASNQLFLPLYYHALSQPIQALLKHPEFTMYPERNGQLENGGVAGYPATIIAQALQLGGSSLVLDAACASSLYSLKLACAYLLSHKADMMLAGAISAADPWFVAMGFSTFKAFPENIPSKPLDQNSSGLNTGEGAGMFVLKRYQDAVNDGDTIHAVIKGVGLSNDGKGKFVLSPNQKGQVKCFERAYQEAGFAPEAIDYIECHATGTPLGDETEVASMDAFFADKPLHFFMGSAKSNFGHLLTAAGMAGLLKIILSMQHNQIPATIGVDTPLVAKHPNIAGKQILQQATAWPQQSGQAKVAGISAFGFGGTNAHLILEETPTDKQVKPTQQSHPTITKTPIAIIGMGAYFGECDSLDSLAKSIFNGQQHFAELPKQRWQGMEQQAELMKILALPDNQLPYGNFIPQFDFDYLYYKIPPEEQAPLLPQQLLMMKVLDQALKDSGLDKGGNVGIIVAMEMDLAIHQFRGRVDLPWALQDGLQQSNIQLTEAQQQALETVLKDSLHNAVEINQFTSFIGNIIPCRICSLWDFSGPAFTISAEENSAFKALEIAQLFLEAGEVDAMVVGAVDLAGSMESVYLQNQRAKANTGKISLSLEESSHGWNLGEGAGAIVLKRQDQLSSDNPKKTYAVVEGFASTRQVSAESMNQACQQAMQQAEVSANDIAYIELHASGIETQDQAEVTAMQQSYGNTRVALGSVKANIGHAFAASGMASVIKTALCLYHRFIPGIPNWQQPKNLASWQDTNCYFPMASHPWLINQSVHDNPESLWSGAKRYAAINSLGYDQCCHHLILGEAENIPVITGNGLVAQSTYLLLIVATTTEQLITELAQLKTRCQQNPKLELKALVLEYFQQYQQAENSDYCISLVISSLAELERELQSGLDGVVEALASGEEWGTPAGSYFTPKPLGDKAKIAFVYPGGFNSYVGMARTIFNLFPELYDLLKDSTSELQKMMRTHYLYPHTLTKPNKKQLKQFEAALGDDAIAMFESGIMTSVIYTKVIQDILGIKPQAAFGHSMGELSMLFSSGAWHNTDYMSHTLHSTATFQNRLVGEMEVVRQAWHIPASTEGGPETVWGTYTLRTSPEVAQPIIDEEDKVFLIIINAPNEIVIAGDDDACQRVVKKLKWRLFPVPIKDVVHNELVKAEFDALKTLHTMPTTVIEGVDFYTAATYQTTELDADVIGNNIATFYTQLVDFPKLVNQVYDDGARIFIELGPQSSCTKWVGESLQAKPHLAVGINRKGVDDLTSLIRLAAKVSSHRVSMNLSRLFPQPAVQTRTELGLSKPVVLGKPPITELILAPEQQALFKTVATRSMTKATMKASAKASHLSHTVASPTAVISTPMSTLTDTNSKTSETITVPMSESKPKTMTTITLTPTPTTDMSSSASVTATQEVDPVTLFATSPALSSHHRSILAKMFDHQIKISQLHERFLATRDEGLQQLSQVLLQDIQHPVTTVPVSSEFNPPSVAPVVRQFFPSQYSKPAKVVFDEQDLREFAYGRIAKVFGDDYKIIDTYPKRVMLPMDPYLLVSRVTEMQAKRGEFKPSKMTTEYDIPHNAWYSTDGQIPVCICIESGQCDLLLISYMGIDFENKGVYLYRLLDCTLTFLDDQPKEGQTLRYEISINSFAKHQHNLLFFFSYECFIGDKMILKMDNGCAGFFSEEDLAKGKGVIRTKEEIAEREQVQKQSFTPFLQCQKTSFSKQDIDFISEGDFAACFAHPSYDKQGKNPSLHFPKDKILMLDRITRVDAKGGLWGLGQLEAEKDLYPDEWYFVSHFRDDPVLAGSLMSEGCVQLLQFYMLYLGLHTLVEDARFQTARNIPQVIRCRGQAVPSDRLMRYRLEVTEIGTSPKPYAKANVEIIIDDRVVVDFRHMCLELSEKSEQEKALIAAAKSGQDMVETIAKPELTQPMSSASRQKPPMPPKPFGIKPEAVITEEQVEHFATGDIVKCFGEEFAIYQQAATPPRRPPRTPNGFLQLMHRVLEIGGEKHVFDKTSSCTAEFDVPTDVWYCEQNSYPALTPYSMLMEIALQPNGFLTSYMGSTLIYPDVNLYFRNLDGEAELYKEMDLRGKTIVNKSTMYATSAVMNNVIQKFTYELICEGETFYKGTAVFGFFTADSLANQVGMDKGKKLPAWYQENQASQATDIDLNSEQAQQHYFTAPANQPYYKLAGGMLNFLDSVKVIADGGAYGKGYVHALKVIDPSDWFYPCHFYEDPVMPGSLGVEAMIQSMQIFALHQGLGNTMSNPRFALVLGTAKWMYRGQIIPKNKEMTLEIHMKSIQTSPTQIDILADGNLWKDGLRIYHVEDIGLSVQEAE